MGIIRKKTKKRVLCNHLGSFGDYCNKCGAKKNLTGYGYQMGWVEEEIEETIFCTHIGESGTYCSKCGDRLRF